MRKAFHVGVVLLLVLMVGCAAVGRSHGTGEVTVFVDEHGRLLGNGYTLDQSELPMFAKEVGDRRVIVRPSDGPSLTTLVKARDQLKAAGVRDVVLHQ